MSGQIIDLNKIRPELREYFDKEKLLVYFYSPNCNACRYQAPVIDNLNSKNFNILSIDVTKDLQLARVFGIMGTPSIVLMKGNLVKEVFVGFQNQDKLIQVYKTN